MPAAKVRVSLSAKAITAYDDGGKMIALFPCSIAADKEKRTPGQLTVQTVAVNPNYTFDPVNFPELDDTQKGYGKLIVPPRPEEPRRHGVDRPKPGRLWDTRHAASRPDWQDVFAWMFSVGELERQSSRADGADRHGGGRGGVAPALQAAVHG